MNSQDPRVVTVIPLLEEEQFALFLRLAMAMAMVIEGDEGGKQYISNEEEEHNTKEMPHYHIA